MSEEFNNDDMWQSYSYMTPKKITEELRAGGIVGQDNAVKTTSLILYNHIRGRTSVNLFAAPSGSGKTHIYRILQKEYGIDNIVIHDASTLTVEGWKGNNKISTIFKNLPPEHRERIILVLDEFDKILEQKHYNHSDSIQNELLRLCDHDTLFFGSENENEQGFYVDTTGISVVFLGAFQRLMENKSRNAVSIGFGRQSRCNCDYSNSEITIEDLIDYGLKQELAGRITRITCMSPLSIENLTRIGQQEVRNLEQQLKRKISVDYSILLHLANIAVKKPFGARWIKFQLSNSLDELIYENPNAESYTIDFNMIEADKCNQAEVCME